MEMIDQSLGQLARRIPGATRVFDAHHFDFCCAGNRTLRTVAAAAGVPSDKILIRFRRSAVILRCQWLVSKE